MGIDDQPKSDRSEREVPTEPGPNDFKVGERVIPNWPPYDQRGGQPIGTVDEVRYDEENRYWRSHVKWDAGADWSKNLGRGFDPDGWFKQADIRDEDHWST